MLFGCYLSETEKPPAVQTFFLERFVQAQVAVADPEYLTFAGFLCCSPSPLRDIGGLCSAAFEPTRSNRFLITHQLHE
jgi:hypothetical protein